MTTPHVLDLAGREAYRKQLISEIKLDGGTIPDNATIDEARRYKKGIKYQSSSGSNVVSPVHGEEVYDPDKDLVKHEHAKRKYIRKH